MTLPQSVYEHVTDYLQTMWMLRPSTPPREVTIDLPELLVESLGTGAEFLAHYLTELAETGASDPETHPPPSPVLCRICERQITPWWFEKHTEGCTQEYRAESEVSLAQDALTEHRPAIVKVLDALDPETRQGRPVSGELVIPLLPTAEYKGLPIGPAKTSPLSSGSAGKGTPAGTPPQSRDSSASGGLGHSRGKSFAVRRPLSKIVTLLVDLCDTALDISMPAIKGCNEGEEGFRSQSPQSESRISQVLNWQTPSVATSEHEQGLSALITDTENLAQAKVDAVLRHREILEYTERIRVEFNSLVLDCIDAAIKKATSIKAGEISSSSDEEDEEDEIQEDKQEPVAGDENAVSSYDGSPAMVSSMAHALRDIPDHSRVGSEGRQSSIPASSTRSSSPGECPTPRSHRNTLSFLGRSDSINKRTSMLLGSDAGDSDTGMSHSAIITHRRVESPGSDANLVRSASSGERKRRSLRLPNMPSPGRNPSPARGAPPPASPLRIPKPRLPHGLDSMPSPVTSPPLSSTEHSSPIPTGLRHRRESSAASSTADLSKPPPSPRLNSISQPPARAVATSIKDFEIIKPISKGAFGSVYLAKKKSTGDYFAMKCLRKGDMVAKNQVTNVKAERAIMMWQGESDFVAKLYWTFSSRDYLFLVMEYLNGGDCASLVKVLGSLPEDWAKKYLAEVVLGVEHLHGRGIVHRDLKPDNLLIDQKGHLKLTDFGLSRMGLIGRQKRALIEENEPTPDLLKQGPFARTTSIGSSRSASFDFQAIGGHSPNSTPLMTPDLAGSLGQPTYFNLNREPSIQGKRHSRRESGYRSDSGNSDSFSAMFRNFSLNEDTLQRGESIAEETFEADAERSRSPDLYGLRPTMSNQSAGSHAGEREGTPPLSSIMPPPPMALFDPDDENRRFVGTPDYLAPETINGLGQDEMSDWWSLGCILFEFLYGYPPFHGDTPDIVFENILNRKIDWPDKDYADISEEAKDLMDKLMTIDPKARLGSNMAEKFPSAGEEIRAHPWFNGINWNTLLEDEAQFIPNPENPEDTEYFDARGATLQTFTEEMEGQESSPNITPGTDNYDRPHDALSRVRSQVNSMKRGLMPLHIPPHVRDNRSRRLSEPVANDDFGNFAFKNLPVLEKANKEVIQKMRVEAQQKTIRGGGPSQPTSAVSTVPPTLEGSPLLAGPLKRTLSANKGPIRPVSPSNITLANPSPNRTSQPSSPLVSFSTGQNHERRKTSSSSSILSHQSSNSLQPGSAIEPPKLMTGFFNASATSMASSPVRTNRHSVNMSVASPEKTSVKPSRPHSMHIPSSRARSQTVGSADGDLIPAIPAVNPKRHSQVFDVSPSSSDTEDRAQALLRVQRRRQSSRSVSKIMLTEGPTFRPLDILICEDHPVSRIVMEKLFEKLKCRTIAVNNGPEAARFAMSKVQFDIILMEYKLPHINGADVARMIRDTKSANTQTPIVAVTGYLRELPQTHHFDSLIEKPPTLEKLTEVLLNLCQWKPPPPGYVAPKPIPLAHGHGISHSSLRQESRQSKDDSPSSQSSGPFSHVPGLYNPASREHSIGSSFFGDTDSANTDDSSRADIPVIIGRQSDDWAPNNGLGITEDPSSTAAFVDKHFIHPGLPHLLHQNSAPSVMSDPRTPRKQRSAEAVKAKREDLLKKRHDCAESGDDEDEELGDVQVRARSPVGKSRVKAAAASKLGTEMMRTNSRGSVSSSGGGPDDGGLTKVPSVTSFPSPPAASTTITAASEDTIMKDVTQPPEIFPAVSKGDAEAFVDMDATPRPPATAAIASIEQAPEKAEPRSPSPVKSK